MILDSSSCLEQLKAVDIRGMRIRNKGRVGSGHVPDLDRWVYCTCYQAIPLHTCFGSTMLQNNNIMIIIIMDYHYLRKSAFSAFLQ